MFEVVSFNVEDFVLMVDHKVLMVESFEDGVWWGSDADGAEFEIDPDNVMNVLP